MTTETQVEVAGTPAPVVTEDVKPTVPDTPEATAASGDVEQKEQAQEKMFTQAEVDALIQKRLRKEALRVQRQTEAQLREAQAARVAQTPPQRDDFRDDDAYAQAHLDHLAAKRAEEIIRERERAQKAEQRAETFMEKAEKASERYQDFHAVVSNPSLPINEHMAEFIAESEIGADVAYFLGKNLVKAAQIAKMSPVGATRELTRLEAEIAAKPKATPSNAPEPIKPVGTRGKASTSALPSDDDDIDTWMKKEQARMRGR